MMCGATPSLAMPLAHVRRRSCSVQGGKSATGGIAASSFAFDCEKPSGGKTSAVSAEVSARRSDRSTSSACSLSGITCWRKLEATGFSIAEIDLSIEGLTHKANGDPDPADDLPATSNRPPVAEPGDLWLLGRHRLYCGSATDAEAYKRLCHVVGGLLFRDFGHNHR